MSRMTPAHFPAALYRHFDAAGQLLYVGVTNDIARRTGQHRANSAWFAKSAKLTVEWLDDRAAALMAERRAIIQEKPAHNAHCTLEKSSGAAEFIDSIGKQQLADCLGVTFAAVRNAHWRDRIPASWALVVALLCDKHGLYCPMHAFNWKGRKGADLRCVSTLMFRDDHMPTRQGAGQ